MAVEINRMGVIDRLNQEASGKSRFKSATPGRDDRVRDECPDDTEQSPARRLQDRRR
jgi:hypothetical protein